MHGRRLLSDRKARLKLRRATPDDEPQVLALMEAALGWKPSDPNQDFFTWKHIENPFGRSPAWVAEVDGELAGFRTFMRWRFLTPDGPVEAVRAVDTATHPAHQGRGIFTALTLHALDELARDGLSFVFNTPNERSRPGYLKMGWTPLGRLPVAARVAGLAGATRMLRARTPADLWSVPTSAGDPPLDVFADAGSVQELVRAGAAGRVVTDRSVQFLRWRYGFGPLHYRVITARGGLTGGAAVFRLRRRGGAIEAAVSDLLAPGKRVRRELVRRVLKLSGADYAISLGSSRSGLPLYRQGPLLTHRTLTRSEHRPLEDWSLALGDIELF